ncbi:hypothetical protein CSUI_009362, partial [Cystoisospora suis]
VCCDGRNDHHLSNKKLFSASLLSLLFFFFPFLWETLSWSLEKGDFSIPLRSKSKQAILWLWLLRPCDHRHFSRVNSFFSSSTRSSPSVFLFPLVFFCPGSFVILVVVSPTSVSLLLFSFTSAPFLCGRRAPSVLPFD